MRDLRRMRNQRRWSTSAADQVSMPASVFFFGTWWSSIKQKWNIHQICAVFVRLLSLDWHCQRRAFWTKHTLNKVDGKEMEEKFSFLKKVICPEKWVPKLFIKRRKRDSQRRKSAYFKRIFQENIKNCVFALSSGLASAAFPSSNPFVKIVVTGKLGRSAWKRKR